MIYPSLSKPIEQKTVLPSKRFYIPCPECGKLMNQKNFAGCSGIVVDLCKPHGIWFDRQELQGIINFIKNGGLHKARENELANLRAEQNRLTAMQYDHSLDLLSMREHTILPNPSDDGSIIDIIFSICKKIF